MIKLVDLIPEVKINTPSSVIKVTDRGRELIQHYVNIWVAQKALGLVEEFDIIELAHNKYEDKLLHHVSLLAMFLDEKVLDKYEPVHHDRAYKRYDLTLGGDEETFDLYLKDFRKHNLIK